MNSPDLHWPCLSAARPNLDDNQVHVWRAALRACASEIEHSSSFLSADEHTRADRFHFDKDRDRYIIHQTILRTVCCLA
jgi:4'-phosphopantetheinyl transferase